MPQVTHAEKEKWQDVWVVGETQGAELAPVTRQLLGAGSRLAQQLGQELVLVMIGWEVGEAAFEARLYGASRLLIADHPSLAKYTTARYAHVVSTLIDMHRPNIVLFAATCFGRDLAPRVAARVKTGLTADALELHIDSEGRFVQVCPGYGGRLLADIWCPDHRPQMVTVRPNAFPTPSPSKEQEIDVVSVGDIAASAQDPVMVLALEADPHAGEVNLPEAKVIVAGGRGLKSRENFQRLYELADLVGGAVAATRAVVDEGWAPPYCQVGQTGLTVQPKLYLALGISGAIQHVAGVSNAETIVAVNTDPKAPIFDVADYGFVADAVEVLEVLIGKVRASLQGGRA